MTIYRRLAEYGCGLWGLLTLAYVAVRAARLSFVHDESLTYIYAAQSRVPLWVVLTNNRARVPPNNHLLNSLLMRLSLSAFGTSEFALRLPNVIAYFLFAVSSFLLVKRFRSSFVAFGTFVVLTANPFVLDFFSLARGYGLAMGLEMVSLVFFCRYFETKTPQHTARFLPFLFAIGSVLSNFALINFCLALLAVFILAQVWSASRQNALRRVIAETWPGISAIILLLSVVVPMLLKLKATGWLEELGGSSGFFSDTVVSLARNTLYSDDPVLPLETLLASAAVLLFLLSFAGTIWLIYKNKFVISAEAVPAPTLIVPVTAIAAAGSVLQHYLFDVNYLSGRTAAFFLPLFVLSLGVLFDGIWVVLGPKNASRFVLCSIFAVLMAVALINFGAHANTTHSLVWKYDADTKQFMEDLVRFHDRQVSASPNLRNARMNLGVDWPFEPTVNFYIIHKNLDGWLNFVDRNGITSRDYDYYFSSDSSRRLLSTRPVAAFKTYFLTGNTFAFRIRN